MTSDLILHLARRAMETAMLVSAPVLATALVVGFFTAMLQAITSIRDMTLGMVLKIAAVGVTILLAGGWMMQHTLKFTLEIFGHLKTMAQ